MDIDEKAEELFQEVNSLLKSCEIYDFFLLETKETIKNLARDIVNDLAGQLFTEYALPIVEEWESTILSEWIQLITDQQPPAGLNYTSLGDLFSQRSRNSLIYSCDRL